MATRLERLVMMDSLLRRNRRLTLDDLCNKFEVKPRTIFQDLKIMKENLGLDIQYDRTNKTYYNANPQKALPRFDLTIEELNTLKAALNKLQDNSQVRYLAESVWSKVKERTVTDNVEP
jgi:predicted DNA-binding transcriptional regulator YafY